MLLEIPFLTCLSLFFSPLDLRYRRDDRRNHTCNTLAGALEAVSRLTIDIVVIPPTSRPQRQPFLRLSHKKESHIYRRSYSKFISSTLSQPILMRPWPLGARRSEACLCCAKALLQRGCYCRFVSQSLSNSRSPCSESCRSAEMPVILIFPILVSKTRFYRRAF